MSARRVLLAALLATAHRAACEPVAREQGDVALAAGDVADVAEGELTVPVGAESAHAEPQPPEPLREREGGDGECAPQGAPTLNEAGGGALPAAGVASGGKPVLGGARRGLSRLRASALTPRSVYRRTAAFYAGCTALLMPLWEPRHVQALLEALRLPPPARSALLGAASAVYSVRQSHMLPCLLAHEVITDVSADVTAQAFEAQGAALEAAEEGEEPPRDGSAGPPAPALVSLDWRRVLRSTSASLVSDDFPFLLWSRSLWVLSERLVARLRGAKNLPPRLVAFLTHGLSISVAKMVVTQLLYESASNALYLSLQALMRGMGWRGARQELRDKFFKCWRDGVVFWSAAHVVVFAMPFWWLQPIVDNTFTLFFNTCEAREGQGWGRHSARCFAAMCCPLRPARASGCADAPPPPCMPWPCPQTSPFSRTPRRANDDRAPAQPRPRAGC